ncbi:MAG: class I SAM-dependent methyltransferase [Mycobacteriales bacterium]
MSPEPRPSVEEVLGAAHHWYHVVDLEPGVATPGWIDLRPHVGATRLPASLAGLRALDVGTFDGFWAFELERRGAEVIGIDIDQIPPPDTPRSRWARVQAELGGAVPGTGFELLRRWFGSTVERRSVNVYDLTTEAVDGPVDLVFLGALLQHLRDPVGALERVREVLAPDGTLVLFEVVDKKLSRSSEPLAKLRINETTFTWWYANRACLRAWVQAAGFRDVQDLGHRDVVDSTGTTQRFVTLHARP